MGTPNRSNPASRSQKLAVSPDGYVRLTPAALRAVALQHVLSELDVEPAPAVAVAGARAASIFGFTEWASAGTPALSLGWDWRLDTAGGEVRYERDGEIRSNIMLLDPRRRDFGALATGVLLCGIVDDMRWREVVGHYITNRYACHLSDLTVT